MTPYEQIERDFSEISASAAQCLSNRSILVTGATGFLGSLLVRYIGYANRELGLGAQTFALVRDIDKARKVIGTEIESGTAIPIVADLMRDDISVDQDVDVVVHLASITASAVMAARPVDVIKTSINGTEAALRIANRKSAKLVYASSMEVYGTMPSSEPAAEDDLGYIDLCSPRSCYPESKRLCENLCSAYMRQFDVECTTARFAAVIGCGVSPSDNRAVNQFVRSALEQRDIVLHTAGLSEANYVYSSDALAAILALVGSGKPGCAYNVANSSAHMTIREVAELVAAEVSSGTSRVLVNDTSGDHGYAADVRLSLDCSKLEGLGWSARVDMPEAVRRLAAYISSNEDRGGQR